MGTYSTSERTRLALIQAAGELVAELGTGRVSTRAIANKAGENLGAIHYHFGGKEELLKEMLRFACHSQEGPTLAQVIRSMLEDLSTPPQQVEAVRTVVRHLVQETLSPEKPRWVGRVLFQVVQHQGPLRTFLQEEMINPLMDAMHDLFHRIRPDWSESEIYLAINVLFGPIVFHSDHNEIVRDRLGADAIPSDYLLRFERRVLADTLRAVGLWLDANETADARNG